MCSVRKMLNAGCYVMLLFMRHPPLAQLLFEFTPAGLWEALIVTHLASLVGLLQTPMDHIQALL